MPTCYVCAHKFAPSARGKAKSRARNNVRRSTAHTMCTCLCGEVYLMESSSSSSQSSPQALGKEDEAKLDAVLSKAGLLHLKSVFLKEKVMFVCMCCML